MALFRHGEESHRVMLQVSPTTPGGQVHVNAFLVPLQVAFGLTHGLSMHWSATERFKQNYKVVTIDLHVYYPVIVLPYVSLIKVGKSGNSVGSIGSNRNRPTSVPFSIHM